MQSSLQLDLLISGLPFPPTPQLWWQQDLALRTRNFKTVLNTTGSPEKVNQEHNFAYALLQFTKAVFSFTGASYTNIYLIIS